MKTSPLVAIAHSVLLPRNIQIQNVDIAVTVRWNMKSVTTLSSIDLLYFLAQSQTRTTTKGTLQFVF